MTTPWRCSCCRLEFESWREAEDHFSTPEHITRDQEEHAEFVRQQEEKRQRGERK